MSLKKKQEKKTQQHPNPEFSYQQYTLPRMNQYNGIVLLFEMKIDESSYL